uniref:Uncharacterized protein n=1 Tax=Oryza rufipogon TaxID=4529 RepID=A0A0E0RI13_ORYRU
MNARLGHLKWREPHAGRPARTVFRGIRPAGAHPTRGTEKLIEYKTYLQALPYFDRSEGDRGSNGGVNARCQRNDRPDRG